MSTVLEGNLGTTPELRFAGQGSQAQAVTTLRVCSNRRRRLDDGSFETVDELWMNVEVWGKKAEACARALRKGAPLVIVGELRDNSYEKDGKRIPAVKLVAQHVALNLSRLHNVTYELLKAQDVSNGAPASGAPQRDSAHGPGPDLDPGPDFDPFPPADEPLP